MWESKGGMDMTALIIAILGGSIIIGLPLMFIATNILKLIEHKNNGE